MNKRFQKLARQAELNLELQSLKVEKFAELIVRECISKAEDYGLGVDAVEQMKEHFGVEE